MTTKHFTAIALAIGALAIATGAQAQEKVKIGLITDMSSLYSDVEGKNGAARDWLGQIRHPRCTGQGQRECDRLVERSRDALRADRRTQGVAQGLDRLTVGVPNHLMSVRSAGVDTDKRIDSCIRRGPRQRGHELAQVVRHDADQFARDPSRRVVVGRRKSLVVVEVDLDRGRRRAEAEALSGRFLLGACGDAPNVTRHLSSGGPRRRRLRTGDGQRPQWRQCGQLVGTALCDEWRLA